MIELNYPFPWILNHKTDYKSVPMDSESLKKLKN